jgi:histidinol dehydrogenase
MPEEFIMPVPKADAQVQMEIHALRQISDALSTTNKSLSNLTTDVRDVRERMIRIEAKDIEAKIETLSREMVKRIDQADDDIDKACTRLRVLEIDFAAMKSRFLPAGIAGAALIAGVVGYFVKALFSS